MLTNCVITCMEVLAPSSETSTRCTGLRDAVLWTSVCAARVQRPLRLRDRRDALRQPLRLHLICRRRLRGPREALDKGVCHTCSAAAATACASRTCTACLFDTNCLLLTSARCTGCPRLRLEPRRVSLRAVPWTWGVRHVLSRQWYCVRLGNVQLHLSIPLESSLTSERCHAQVLRSVREFPEIVFSHYSPRARSTFATCS